MKKPTWVNVVGIMTIVMGCFGLLGALQTFSMPKVMAMQRQMMPEMQKRVEEKGGHDGVSSEEITKMLKKMGEVPSWFDSWCIASGTMALVLSIGFIIIGISLLQLKMIGINAFYAVAGLDIVFLIGRGLINFAAMSWLGISSIFVGGLAIIVMIILLITVAKGNKEAFAQSQ